MTAPAEPHVHGPFAVVGDSLRPDGVQCEGCGDRWPKCTQEHAWQVDTRGREATPVVMRCAACGESRALDSKGR